MGPAGGRVKVSGGGQTRKGAGPGDMVKAGRESGFPGRGGSGQAVGMSKRYWAGGAGSRAWQGSQGPEDRGSQEQQGQVGMTTRGQARCGRDDGRGRNGPGSEEAVMGNSSQLCQARWGWGQEMEMEPGQGHRVGQGYGKGE